ncbi:MAG: dTMP kinase [Bacteroidia bacterium]
MSKTLFIAFEGIDGSGKSTQSKLLYEKMLNNNHKVFLTAEPTDRVIGKLIRDIFKGNINASQETIAALFAADRLDHLMNEENGMLKMKQNGNHVITDRYYFSSYAYHGTHVNMDWVIQCNTLAANMLKPDLTIFIDVEPDVCMERISQSRVNTELYETLDNLKNVRNKYFEAFEKLKLSENIFITNGNLSESQVAENVWNELSKLI